MYEYNTHFLAINAYMSVATHNPQSVIGLMSSTELSFQYHILVTNCLKFGVAVH
jgi:hypothetical protein